MAARNAALLMVAGLVALAVSAVWPWLVPTRWVWDTEQAQQQSRAAAEMHRMTHIAAEATLDERMAAQQRARIERDLQRAKDEYQRSRSALDSARFRAHTLPSVIRWGGVLLLTIGVIRYVSLRGK